MWERGERKQVWDERRRKKVKCAMWKEKQCNRCSEMRQKERKERGEILNEDGREIRWLKEIWKRRERIKKKGVGDRKKG
jgi:hypothetical protein